jgi:aryl-alcohol dehydrogenase-like predicted oxidoreductase
LEALDRISDRHNSTPGKVALAWLIGRPSITAPIASATSIAQLNDLIEATKLKLDHASIDELNEASSTKGAAATGSA